MPFKPSHNYQRAERDRTKKASKDAKLQERKEQAMLRRANKAVAAEPPSGKVQESAE